MTQAFVKVRLDRAAELHGQRVSLAVERLAGRDAYPALADAVFLDVGLLLALEADAHAARQELGVVERAFRVVGQAVGRRIGHGAGT